MEWHQKEEIILSFIKTIFEEIIAENPTLPIRVGARVGAEISDILEDKFVQKAENKENILKVGGAPKGKTKNPYDIYFVYEFSSLEQQLVWIDIKATNLSYKDSNPDMGTYKKFIKFFGSGNYFAVYCKLAYLPKGEQLQFVKTPQDEIVTVFLLKDIHHSFRIQPNNQLQVNYAAPSEPRSLSEFIDLLKTKVQESLERKKKIIDREMKNLNNEFESIKQIVQNILSR
jgi:hypothetical protein